MKRPQKIVKRNWLLETLERRCLMAADLQVGPLPALDEPYAEYNATNTQTIVTTSFDVAGVPADFEDTFTAKVNAQIERVAPDNLTSFIIALQTTMAGDQASEFINNDLALEELSNQYANRLPPSTLSIPTPVTQPAAQSIHSVNRARNEAWHLIGDSQGMSFSPAGEFTFESITWLPEDFVPVRSETTAEQDVFLAHGLSKGTELEYRTLTVDIRQRQLLSDKVTDEVTAGFVAMELAGVPWFSVVWQMETDPARPIDWNSTPFQQFNEQWIVRPGMHKFYYQQVGDDQWQAVSENIPFTAFSAHHFVIEGDKLMAFGDDLIDGLDAPVRIVVNLTTGAVESFEVISEEEVVPTNLEMQRLVDGAPLGRRSPGFEIIYVDSFDTLQLESNSPQPPQPDRLYVLAPNTPTLAASLQESSSGVQATPLPETKQTAVEEEPLVAAIETFDTAVNQMPLVAGTTNSGKADDLPIIPDSDALSTEEEPSLVSGTLGDELHRRP